jgi:homoserine O-succinyltransferase
MGVRPARVQPGDPAGTPGAMPPPRRWSCVVVNNMPDGAFEATERQYLDLLDAGSGDGVVEVTLTTLAGVPRGERAAARIADRYVPVGALWSDPPDLLIVTGSNPLAPRIEEEPYWAELTGLLSWGRDRVPSMLLSCLSAHAALSVFDGITRTRLPAKCTGVFPQQVDGAHPLAAGLSPSVVLPHSRINAVAPEVVAAAGYRAALGSEAVGWSVVTKESGRSQMVLVQGHPEYDPSSLLREYHRDLRRYVLGERDELPCLPLHCTAPEDWEWIEELHRRVATGGERDPALLEAFPFDELGERAGWPWRDVAVRLYTNWMAGVEGE